MRDVDADPAALQTLGDGDRRPAPAERVEDDIALVAAGLDDALQEGFWLLGGVAQSLVVPRPE